MRLTRGVLKWRRLPVWARLVALGLVPFVGIAAVATPTVIDRWQVASRTATVARRVDAVRSLYVLQSAWMSEIAPTEAELRAGQFGITVDVASSLIGFDLDARRGDARANVDRALAVFTTVDRAMADQVGTLIGQTRQAFDTGRDLDAVHAADTNAVELLDKAGEPLLRALLRAASSSGESADIESATRVVTDTFELYQAYVDQIEALFQATVQGSGTDPQLARYKLAAARELFDQTVAELHRYESPTITPALDDMFAQPDVVALETAVDSQLTVPAPTASDPAGVAVVFRAGFSTADRINALVHRAADEAETQAVRQHDNAVGSLRNAFIVFLAAIIGSLLLALVIARSITRRLEPLARRARQVSQGQLDGDAADETGPPETAVVAQALNETVANLRRLDDQAAAVARGELDADVLNQPAIGAIGDSIHVTVQRLADAWREGEDLKQRLAHQANHDLLTGLPNRKAALETLSGALARALRHGETVAVLFVDLDDFKRINDSYGHHTGDRVLHLCAQRLAVSVRHGDVVARLGGDEFVVITERVGNVRDVADLAGRIVDALSAPFELDGALTHVGASVGIGLSVGNHPDSLDLIRDADNAVHRAKRMGKGRVEIFDESARDELAADSALEHALRVALGNGELVLHYQPIVGTATGLIHGFEALARWTVDGVPIPPDRFVGVAEHSDLVCELGRWALSAAAGQLRVWTDDGTVGDGYMAVNISGRHLLHHDFVADVRTAIDGSGIDPHRLLLEITETVVLEDLPGAGTVLADLRALGVRVALDDFGTGYTSIAHLWQLPIDVIKIDGSFVAKLDTKHDRALVEMMVEVAHTLELGLVGEGVETDEQRDVLAGLGCDSIQGYLIARPCPAGDVDVAAIERRS